MRIPPFSAPFRRALTVVVVLPVLLSACATSDVTTPSVNDATTPVTRTSSPPSTRTSAPPVRVSIKPAHGVKAALPSGSLAITATNGTVTDVVVRTSGATSENVKGTFANGRWTPTRHFLLDQSYRVAVTATDQAGKTITKKSTFHTLKPTTVAQYSVPYSGSEVGVGMPATIQFASAVETKALRAEVERNVSVTTSPSQPGSWGWIDNRQLMWRPKTFWQPGTTVTVKAQLAGVQTGTDKWVGRDTTARMTIGDSRISYVDIKRHTMKVTKNGKTVRVLPVTTGKPGFVTRSGTKVIIERVPAMTMDSETVAIPKNSKESYRLRVKWAMRITWTGEFLHAAPWSVASQGKANVSHGCTGLSTSNAGWMFHFSKAGDVVRYTGSKRIFKPTEGIGVWQYSWADWQKQSAQAA